MRRLTVLLLFSALITITTYCFADPPMPQNLTVSLSAPSLIGGSEEPGSIVLPSSAKKSELVTLYSSDPADTLTPQTLTVTPGIPAPFIISTDTTPSLKSIVVSASCADYTGAANLTVQAPALDRIILSTGSGSSNDTVTGVVQLTGPAPPGGETIELSTSNPAVQVAPTEVTVDHGNDLSSSFQLSSDNLKTLASTVLSASIHYKYITSDIATSVSVSAVSTSSYVLPQGTTIFVTAPDGVSSEHAKLGDIILFNVATDVYGQLTNDPSSRVLIIPRGNPAICRVRYVRHSKGIFEHGRLGVEIESVEAIDGSLLDVSASQSSYNNPNERSKTKRGEINNITSNGVTHAVIIGRTDSTLVPAELLSIVAAYGLTTLDSNSQSIDILGLGAVVSSSNFNALFTGVQATLPAGVTFEVQTVTPNSIQVRNPIAGQ